MRTGELTGLMRGCVSTTRRLDLEKVNSAIPYRAGWTSQNGNPAKERTSKSPE